MKTSFDPVHLSRFLALAALTFGGGVNAADPGVPLPEPRHLAGGVTQEDRVALRAEVDRHSLWLVTAVSKTGAYLADVEVQISDEHQRTVFGARLPGPWLLVDLPPGRYEVRASFGGDTQRRATTIHAGDHRQLIFYFDAEGDVLPLR